MTKVYDSRGTTTYHSYSGNEYACGSTTGSGSYVYKTTMLSNIFIPKYDGSLSFNAKITATISGSEKVYTSKYSKIGLVSGFIDGFKNQGYGALVKSGEYDTLFTDTGVEHAIVMSDLWNLRPPDTLTKTITLSGIIKVSKGIPIYLISYNSMYGPANDGVLKIQLNSFTLKGSLV